MNHGTSNDSETGSEGCPPEPISTLADLQLKAYENRVRERLMAKYPTKPDDLRSRSRSLFKFTLRTLADGAGDGLGLITGRGW
jgi:hypothetical protein